MGCSAERVRKQTRVRLTHLQQTSAATLSAHAMIMTNGGDARIVLNADTGLNQYNSTPYPRDVLAFASSTANDISAEAFAWLERTHADPARLDDGIVYASHLDDIRARVLRAYSLPQDIEIFFAPSGTDLEYVALLATAGRNGACGIRNLLLGKDEVGSGCIHSAAGHYFAQETALGIPVLPGQQVAGMVPVSMGDIPVRDDDGEAHDSAAMTRDILDHVDNALDAGEFPLVHIVHGSKTGLVLPGLADVDNLIGRFGDRIGFVVDACQARITEQAVRDYLARGIIVFLTGSKFMGGPPFSGMALLPAGTARGAQPLGAGVANIFRRAEIPAGWPGRDGTCDSGNAGLALRLAASVFELERFQALPVTDVVRVVTAFTAATDRLVADLNIRKVGSAAPGEEQEWADHPVEMQTLVTLDLCHDRMGMQTRSIGFAEAADLHRRVMRHGVRFGQPVKCVRLADSGEWSATLRIGLSMPQVVRMASLDDAALTDALDEQLGRLAAALSAEMG